MLTLVRCGSILVVSEVSAWSWWKAGHVLNWLIQRQARDQCEGEKTHQKKTWHTSYHEGCCWRHCIPLSQYKCFKSNICINGVSWKLCACYLFYTDLFHKFICRRKSITATQLYQGQKHTLHCYSTPTQLQHILQVKTREAKFKSCPTRGRT